MRARTEAKMTQKICHPCQTASSVRGPPPRANRDMPMVDSDTQPQQTHTGERNRKEMQWRARTAAKCFPPPSHSCAPTKGSGSGTLRFPSAVDRQRMHTHGFGAVYSKTNSGWRNRRRRKKRAKIVDFRGSSRPVLAHRVHDAPYDKWQHRTYRMTRAAKMRISNFQSRIAFSRGDITQ